MAINATNLEIAPRATPPRAHGLPIIGSLPALLRRQFDFFLEARERHGDIYSLDLGLLQAVVLNHPRQMQHIFVDNVQNYRKSGGLWETVRVLLGNGLVVSEGDFWLRQRRMIQPHFHRRRLAGITEAMVSATEAGLPAWERSADRLRPFDVKMGFEEVTMRVIARALFGQGLRPEDLGTTSSNLGYILDYLTIAMLTSALPRWLPIPGARRNQRSVAAIDSVVMRIIAQERSAATPSDSLLTTLLQMVDEESGAGMTDIQLRDEVMTFFLAGYETTNLALTWAVHYLTQQPELMRQAQAEVDQVLGGRAPTFADLAQLSYLRKVVQETLRLRPPFWQITRTAIADDQIDGFAIPAGTLVVSLIYAAHQHPAIWDAPDRFDPERFANEQVESRHKLAWMPFGAGQRQCIGRDFSIMEAQIVLAMILQRYTLEALPGHTAAPLPSGTLKPQGGVLVRLQRRR
jgi:cytochrome P450